MNRLLSTLLIALTLLADARAKAPTVEAEDLQRLTGPIWTGTLNYIDYRSGATTSIPSTLTVTESIDDPSSWNFEYKYPFEPKSNSTAKLTIHQDGTMLSDESVIERLDRADEVTRFVTQKPGLDNNKKAMLKFTYVLKPNTFSIKKEVRFEGAKDFSERHTYSWKR